MRSLDEPGGAKRSKAGQGGTQRSQEPGRARRGPREARTSCKLQKGGSRREALVVPGGGGEQCGDDSKSKDC